MKTSAYIAIFALLVLIVVISVLVNFSRQETAPPGGNSQLSAVTKGENPDTSEQPDSPPAQPSQETERHSASLTISTNDTEDEPTTSYAPPSPPRAAARLAGTDGEILARHVVKRGDNYTKLAKKYYGCSENKAPLFARHIEHANPGKGATNLQPHSTLIIPVLTPELAARLDGRTITAGTATMIPARRSGQDLSAYRIYIAQSGDTLTKVARVKLGTERKWKELFELNKKLGLMKNPDELKKGHLIVLGLK